MQLREVLGDAARDAPPVEVTALAYDNRLVTPGTLFFCVPGFTRDGHEFAPDAVARGAVALVVQRPLGLGVPEIVVDDVRAAMAPAAAAINGDPTAALRAVGITGTNGKTTTAFVVRSLLEAAGVRTGLVGTVNAVVGGRERPMVRTTPEAIDLQGMFAEMRDAGDAAVVMEVSSHALALHRADAIHWAVALFTNLTQDHLDFHPTMEDYFLAKRRLLEAGPEVAVINVDDAYGARLAYDFPDAVRIGIDSLHAQVRANLDSGAELANAAASALGCVASVTGPVDHVSDGARTIAVANGDPLLGTVSGTGCMSTAITGCFLAVASTPLEAAAEAFVAFGVAGEDAAVGAQGPGSFHVALYDALYNLDPETLESRAKVDE